MNKRIFILILCCGLSQARWTCVSDDKGSLLDAPMGVSQDDVLKDDLYIEGCEIEGMATVAAGHDGAVRNDTALTATCFVANLSGRTASPSVAAYVSSDEDMDTIADYPFRSIAVTIAPLERKKITLSGIIIGDGPPSGRNYISVYLDPQNGDTGYADGDPGNNWSDPVEIWIE